MTVQSECILGHRPLIDALLVGAAALLFYGQYAAADQPVIPPGAGIASWYDNGHGDRYVLQVAQGRALAAGERALGIVKSDTNCDPDAQGLSHCRNAIELSNGTRITVIDTHQMMRNRCLSPGERITLTGIGASWAVGTRSGG